MRKVRYNSRNKVDSLHNPILKEGDIIFVGDSIWRASLAVITELTTPFFRIFSTYCLIKA